MTRQRCFSFAMLVAAMAALAGCAGGAGTSSRPADAPLLPQLSHLQHGALLYVSDTAANRVYMYSYPGLKLQGEITQVRRPLGLCVDPSTQNVWVVESPFGNRVFEFAHGQTTPLQSVKIYSGYFLDACAVDPTTGDLAVASTNIEDDPGAVLVFTPGRKKPAFYQNRRMFFYGFVAYDSNGNAFVDGYGGGFRVGEISAGSDKLKLVNLTGVRNRNPGGVQIQGTTLVVGNEKKGVVYQISGGTVVGKTALRGTCLVQQFAIAGTRIIAPNICNSESDVGIYHYPAGGQPVAQITGLKSPFAAVISR